MVEAASANVGDTGVPTQRGELGEVTSSLMPGWESTPRDEGPIGRPGQAERLPRTIGVLEAAELTGLSISTVQRRVDAWRRGVRTDYALKGGTAGATDGKAATRYVDYDDAVALAKQIRGDLPAGRHALSRSTAA